MPTQDDATTQDSKTLTFHIDGKAYPAVWHSAKAPTTQDLDEIEAGIRKKYKLKQPDVAPSPAGAQTAAKLGLPTGQPAGMGPLDQILAGGRAGMDFQQPPVPPTFQPNTPYKPGGSIILPPEEQRSPMGKPIPSRAQEESQQMRSARDFVPPAFGQPYRPPVSSPITDPLLGVLGQAAQLAAWPAFAFGPDKSIGENLGNLGLAEGGELLGPIIKGLKGLGGDVGEAVNKATAKMEPKIGSSAEKEISKAEVKPNLGATEQPKTSVKGKAGSTPAASTKPVREIITPANDTPIGKNDAGEQLYQRADGSVYRMRFNRPNTRPHGYPDFGGDLSPVEHVEPKAPVKAPTSPAVAPKPSTGHLTPETKPEPGVTGIAQAVHEARGIDVNPGEFFKPKELDEYGKQNVASAEKQLAKFEAGKANPSTLHLDTAVYRAKMLELGQAKNKALRDFGKYSDEYKAAAKAEEEWAKRIKPATATVFHGVGTAMQGVNDLESGDWHRMGEAASDWANLAHEAARNRRGGIEGVPTHAEEVGAKAKAAQVATAQKAVKGVQSKMDSALETAAKEETVGKPSTVPKGPKAAEYWAKRFENGSIFQETTPVKATKQSGAIASRGKVPNFTANERKAIWQDAKDLHIDPNAKARAAEAQKIAADPNYKPMTKPLSLEDIAQSLANKYSKESAAYAKAHGTQPIDWDPDWIKEAMAGRKTELRNLDTEMLRVQSARRAAVTSAKVWSEGKSGSFLQTLWDIPRAFKTAGHGAALPGTHGIANILDPKSAGTELRAIGNAWKAQFSPEFHEKMMQRMENKPNYELKVKAGLAIKNTYQEDYSMYAKVFGKFGQMGNRGADMLKIARDERFDQLYRDADPEIRNSPTYMKDLARQVNHEWGAISGKSSVYAERLGFGPKLEASRWQRTIGDPIRTAKDIFSKDPGKKSLAMYRIGRFSRQTAVLMSSLYASDKFLDAATNGKVRINFTDPTKPDFLHYKDTSGNSYDPSGGALGVWRLIAQEARSAYHSAKGTPEISPTTGKPTLEQGLNKMALEGFNYFRGKVNPAISTLVLDPIARKDITGRPLPWAAGDKSDKPPISWTEYGLSQLPIPLEELSNTIYDGFRKESPNDQIAKEGAARFISAIIGVRSSAAPQPPKAKPFKPPTEWSSLPPEVKQQILEQRKIRKAAASPQ